MSLGLTSSAKADQLVEPPVSLGPIELPFSSTETFLPPIPQFNLPFTLESVEFIFSTTVDGTVSISQGSGATAAYDIGFTADITLYDPSGSTILVTDSSGTWSLTGQSVPDDGQSHPFTQTGTGTSTQTITQVGDLAAFIGSGNISLPVSGQGTAFALGNIPYAVTGTGQASTSVQVIYNYSTLVVPEPSYASVVGGLLLLGLSLVGRRRWRRES
ncbi:MAG TPA: choice-of-anchor E domain-containing protein [Bryobacteraceae bacterium]|jgi:hypothetical protein|nr:choice-of-anchor E domain-containing protein [Bryobacteraceae bacterium]